MNHWHSGDRMNMPTFVEKLLASASGSGGGNSTGHHGVEVRYNPGAGDLYEDRFSNYWLITAWSVLAFNVTAMVVVAVSMSSSALSYAWLPHLAGTAIIDAGIAFMAIIYRFVLFPAPLYHSRSLPMEGMPAGPTFREPVQYSGYAAHPYTATRGEGAGYVPAPGQQVGGESPPPNGRAAARSE